MSYSIEDLLLYNLGLQPHWSLLLNERHDLKRFGAFNRYELPLVKEAEDLFITQMALTYEAL